MGKLQLIKKMTLAKAFVLITPEGVDSIAELPEDNAVYSVQTLEALRDQLDQYIDFFKTESGLLHLEDKPKRRKDGRKSSRGQTSRRDK